MARRSGGPSTARGSGRSGTPTVVYVAGIGGFVAAIGLVVQAVAPASLQAGGAVAIYAGVSIGTLALAYGLLRRATDSMSGSVGAFVGGLSGVATLLSENPPTADPLLRAMASPDTLSAVSDAGLVLFFLGWLLLYFGESGR